MNRLPPSNITMLERQFRIIITDIRNVDSTGQQSSMAFQRNTFTLIDGSKLYCTERISKGEIVYAFYDWVNSDGSDRLKFHSEEHPDDTMYQTATEPFHIHPPDTAKIHNATRYPNYHHRELSAVLEYILLRFLETGVISV